MVICRILSNRNRIDSVLSHFKSLVGLEEVSQKVSGSLCLQLIANEEKDYATINMCKEIVEKGTNVKHNSILCERNSSFLLDFLSIGKVKYIELRQFSKEDNVYVSSYNKVAKFCQESCLVNEMQYFIETSKHRLESVFLIDCLLPKPFGKLLRLKQLIRPIALLNFK